MRTMSVFAITLLLLLGSFSDVHAQDRRRAQAAEEAELQKLEQQLKFYIDELEKVKVKRWQDKRNSIARKEAFGEAWDELRREVDQLNQRKSQKESMLLRLDNQIAQMETELKALEDRMKDFGIQLSEKAEDMVKLLKTGFPNSNEPIIESLKKIQAELESRGYRPQADYIEALFAMQMDRYKIGENREIIRDEFALENVTAADPATQAGLPKNPGIVAGFFVRVGTAYKTFISTESPDAAILARSGNLGDQPWVWLENIPAEKKVALHSFKQIIVNGVQDLNAPLFIPIDVILRKSTGAGFAAEEKNTFWKSMIAEWIGAGFVIWFLLGIVILSFIIVTEKMYYVIVKGLGAGGIYRKVNKLVKAGKVDEATKLCAKKGNATARVLHAILQNAQFKRQDAEDSAFATMLSITPRLERQINSINILAGAAPLIGLLGTVSGMINLFSAITMHGTNDPKMMAAGIAEALLSTKWGLIVALPLMLIYNLVQTMVTMVMTDMEKYSASLLNTLYGPRKDV